METSPPCPPVLTRSVHVPVALAAPAGAAAAGPTCDVGNGHLGFTVDDIWAAYRKLSASGVRFKSEPVSITQGPNKGGWAVYFVDPDGITLEMIQRANP